MGNIQLSGLCIVPPSGRANTDIPQAEYSPNCPACRNNMYLLV